MDGMYMNFESREKDILWSGAIHTHLNHNIVYGPGSKKFENSTSKRDQG